MVHKNTPLSLLDVMKRIAYTKRLWLFFSANHVFEEILKFFLSIFIIYKATDLRRATAHQLYCFAIEVWFGANGRKPGQACQLAGLTLHLGAQQHLLAPAKCLLFLFRENFLAAAALMAQKIHGLKV